MQMASRGSGLPPLLFDLRRLAVCGARSPSPTPPAGVAESAESAPAPSPAPVPISALVSWGTNAARLLVSWYEVVFGPYHGAGGPTDGEGGEGDDGEPGPRGSAKRPRRPSERASELPPAVRERNAHLLWLRLCSVPSDPVGAVEALKLTADRETPQYAGLTQTKTLLTEHYTGSKRAEASETYLQALSEDMYKNRISDFNKLPLNTKVKPPAFAPYGRRQDDLDLQTFLRPLYGGSIYSGDGTIRSTRTGRPVGRKRDDDYVYDRSIDDADENLDLALSAMYLGKIDERKMQLDHVVNKAALVALSNIDEFAGAVNDPINIVLALARENASKGSKAVRFPATAAERIVPQTNERLWSPAVFPLGRQAAIARIIAYMALTYPMICTERSQNATGERPCGMRLYWIQRELILDLITQPPEEWEQVVAYGIYAHRRWCNPLVVSQAVRTMVADRNSELHQLLVARLEGTDEGSAALFRALRGMGVDFSVP